MLTSRFGYIPNNYHFVKKAKVVKLFCLDPNQPNGSAPDFENFILWRGRAPVSGVGRKPAAVVGRKPTAGVGQTPAAGVGRKPAARPDPGANIPHSVRDAGARPLLWPAQGESPWPGQGRGVVPAASVAAVKTIQTSWKLWIPNPLRL